MTKPIAPTTSGRRPHRGIRISDGVYDMDIDRICVTDDEYALMLAVLHCIIPDARYPAGEPSFFIETQEQRDAYARFWQEWRRVHKWDGSLRDRFTRRLPPYPPPPPPR